jgi:hypothetical protein
MRPDHLPAHLYPSAWQNEHRLQAAIRLRRGYETHPWYARQDARAGIRFWLGLIASNMPSMGRRRAEIEADEARERMTPEPPEGPR